MSKASHLQFTHNIQTHLAEIARGNVPGSRLISSYGERVASGAEQNRVIWPNGLFSLPPAAGAQMSIVSTSANDDAAGTGARTIEIHYLDASLDRQHETVIMDGLTPVLTTATDIRFIECMHIQAYGTTAVTAGTITASNGGITYSQISEGEVRCSSSARMVPRGKKTFLYGASAGASSGTAAASVVIRIAATELDNHQYIDPLLIIPFGSIAVQDNNQAYTFPAPIPFTEGTVICLTATTDKGATIAGSWFGWEEDA